MCGKVREFSRHEGDTTLINQKFRNKRDSTNTTTHLETSVSMQQLRQQMLEAQQAFSALADRECKSEAKDNKQKCFTYSRTGSCKYGDNCKFEHCRCECAKFKAGSCAYGDACKYLHSTFIESRPEAKVAAVTTKHKAAIHQRRAGADSKANFLLDVQAENWDLEVDDQKPTQQPWCVIEKKRAESIQSVHVMKPPTSFSIGWKTMASIHVTCSLDVIPGAHEIYSERKAQGLGGVRSITHQGISLLFGVEMAYIEGGATPNLLSIGRALQRDDSGQTGVAIFSHEGAVRMRKNAEIERAISRIIDRADELGLLEGTAQLVDRVYTQDTA